MHQTRWNAVQALSAASHGDQAFAAVFGWLSHRAMVPLPELEV